MAGRILVLDDEENYAEMLQGLLKQERFVVDMATKPELALEALEERNYDLVISDYKMPIMDGAVFLKKAREFYPNLPVILVSGLMNTPELVRVANMGVTLVLEKPLDTNYFIEQVSRFVKPMTADEEEAFEKGELQQEEPETATRILSRVYTYPKRLYFLAGENDVSKKFLQDTWDVVQRSPFLFVTGPVGTEFELILKEVSEWKHQGELPNQYLSAGQLKKDSVREAIDGLFNDPSQSNVIAVGDVSATSLDEQAFLLQFLRSDIDHLPGNGNVTYVFWIDNLKPLNVDLQVEIRGNLVKVPNLTTRLGDLAAYTSRYLKEFSEEQQRPTVPELSPEALNLMLQYPWNGNFSQLVKVLKKVVQVMSDEPLPYEALKSILVGIDSRVPIPFSGGNLEEALILKQIEVIEKSAERLDISTRDVLSRLGFDVSAMPPDMGIDQLDLLYPELLEI